MRLARRLLTPLPLLLAFVVPPVLPAQENVATEDVCVADPPPETPPSPGHPWHLIFSLVFAPAGIAYLIPQCEMAAFTDHEFSRDGFFASGGVGGYTNEVIEGEAVFGEVSLFVGPLLLETRWARYWRGVSATMFTPRVGLIMRPRTGLAGGVVLGYRTADGIPDPWRVAGVELELPLYASLGKDGSPWLRLGPIYRWSPDGWNFGYAGELWFNLPKTPLMIAPYFGGLGFRGNDVVVMGITVGSFVRWGEALPRRSN